MQSFLQFIAEAKDIDLDLGAYGSWLNLKTGKVVTVGFEKHADIDVVKKLGPFDKKFEAEMRLLRLPSGRAGIAMVAKILEKPWAKLTHPVKTQRRWGIQVNKKYIKQLWKWMGPWLKDGRDEVFVDDDRGINLGHFMLDMPRDKRAIKQMMEQVIVTEVFDNPYKWSGGGRVRKGSMTPDHQSDIETYKFKASDGEQVEMFANHFWLVKGTEMLPALGIKKEGHAIGLEFTKNATYSMTGRGDAMRILATVLDITKAIIKKHEPTTVYFSADKEKINPEDRTKEKSGRAGAYGAIVRRFAGKMGYKSSVTDDDREVRWQLTKK